MTQVSVAEWFAYEPVMPPVGERDRARHHVLVVLTAQELRTTRGDLDDAVALRLREAASLPEARRSFLGASNPAAQLALALGEQTAIPVRVFRCPMTKMAFDGAPDHAEWVQSGGAARNPYFGSAMPDCGEEILPGK